MKLLYQVQILKDDLDDQIRTYMEETQIMDSPERDYIEDVVRGSISNQDEIDSILSRHAKGWTITRMPKVDLAIMRLSVYEMRYRKDIPVNVSINEAVEMAKIQWRRVQNLCKRCFREGMERTLPGCQGAQRP